MKKDYLSILLKAAVRLAAVLSVAVIAFLVGYILVKGSPHLKP